MSTEANKTIARRLLEEAFSQGNLAVLDEIIAPDQANGGPGALPGMPSGPEGVRMLVTTYRTAFPDLHFTIDEQIAEGNTVVTRWTGRGTHNGELAGMPATGRPTTVVGVVVDRVENGKIVESWGLFDQFGMLQQLGAIPVPGQAG
jgi:steroid delta-isomerase-like uncharacterized protein